MAAYEPRPPRVIPAGNLGEIAREQLEYLLEHVRDGFCVGVEECSECGMMLAVRDLLLNRFVVTELDIKPANRRGVL